MSNSIIDAKYQTFFDAAVEVFRKNYHSLKHCVGAAVLCASGKIYAGINVESSGHGVRAELVALGAALSTGEREILAIVNFMIKTIFLIVCLNVFIASGIFAQDKPNISEVDRIRLAEAFRIGETLGNKVWKNWDKAPFAVLLVTPEHEFLIRHPKPSKDFALVGYDSLLKSSVYFRKRTAPINLLATYPAVGGISTIVIGQAENTSKNTSTPWVITVLHEHFHQLQMSQPTYYKEVDALNLSGGDQTGMWQLNYAFPYKNALTGERFAALSKLLAETLQTKKKSEFSAKLKEYLKARQAFQETLSEADYKYFSLQIWQEGIARYTEWRIADLAARKHQPSKEFRALKDYQPFRETADTILNSQITANLPTLELDKSERLVFYPFGAAEGLLLDRANSKWQNRYFTEKFYIEKYFVKGSDFVLK